MYDFTLKRSRRKTLSLEINKKCEIIVRAPMHLSKKKIDRFVEEHDEWIEKILAKIKILCYNINRTSL